ncbi:hypothetical protein J21TS3_14230 [Paenibacillus cookii]|uniref:Uncharacterized protein n=1 Tax=Paenibacillus cookii TaxID=157839 RepID=A0ABQ4LTM2_9BACL|nr:hypothetical protein J21TS3_14230 [Paenibacillus cookii]
MAVALAISVSVIAVTITVSIIAVTTPVFLCTGSPTLSMRLYGFAFVQAPGLAPSA